MKLLILVLGFVAGGSAIVAAAFMVGGHAAASPPPAVSAPQHLQLAVLDGHDRMYGSNLVVHPGRVVLTIVNRARHAHLFSVPALGVEHVVLPGSMSAPTTTTVSFRVPLGVFHWYCKLPCAKTMEGDIYALKKPPLLDGALWAPAV
jgi:hypothetical protein